MNTQHTALSKPDLLLLIARLFALFGLLMIPVSTALTNIGCAGFVLFLFLSKTFWQRVHLVWKIPVCVASLILFLMLVISISYSIAPFHQAATWVLKYRKLLLLPLLVIAFANSKTWLAPIRLALFSMLCAIVVLSYLNYFGFTHIGPKYDFNISIQHAWVFKDHIIASLFGSFLFYQAIIFAKAHPQYRYLFITIAILDLINLFIMLEGRTGQITTFAIILLFGAQTCAKYFKRSPYKALLSLFIAFISIGGLIFLTSLQKNERLFSVNKEINSYYKTDAATSTGLRLEWAKRSLTIIKKRPIFGYGAAGLNQAFKQYEIDSNPTLTATNYQTSNPHNEYLLMTAQIGLIGLLLLLYFFWQIYQASRTLDPLSAQLLFGWLFIFMMGCLANSLLLDFSEGHLLCMLTGILVGCETTFLSKNQQ